MSYAKSETKCDWCRHEIDDGEDVACKRCYEQLESENSDLKQRIEDLEKGE